MRRVKFVLLLLIASVLNACSLLPKFGGDGTRTERVYMIAPTLPEAATATKHCGDLLVSDIDISPGFRGSRMVYSVNPVELDYFAYSRWADSIGNLLSLPIRQSLEDSGVFSNVIAPPSVAPVNMRLELTDLQLIQRFESREAQSSAMHMQFNAKLIATDPTRLLKSQRFTAQLAAAPNPLGGVEASNQLAAQLIQQLTAFVAENCQ